MGALDGKKILVTRPKGQADGFAARLSGLGAIPILMPAIEIQPLRDTSELDSALRRLGSFDWAVLTSVNGVAAVRSRMQALGIDPSVLASRKLAVIGPATAEALTEFCREPDLVPEQYVSEGIGEALSDVQGKRFLLARADLARKDLAQSLSARGAIVTEVAAYHIRVAVASQEGAEPDVIALTSSAGASAILDRFEAEGREDELRKAAIVCIGPITAGTVESRGYAVAGTASVYTADGLIRAIEELAKEASLA